MISVALVAFARDHANAPQRARVWASSGMGAASAIYFVHRRDATEAVQTLVATITKGIPAPGCAWANPNATRAIVKATAR
jgi:phosphoribosylamine-glycine ligase